MKATIEVLEEEFGGTAAIILPQIVKMEFSPALCEAYESCGILLPMDPELKAAVQRMHHYPASFIEDVIVAKKFGKETVWSGTVSVFSLEGHPKATKAYAWSSPIEGSTKRRYYAVLHIPPVDSPEKAVRASIVQDCKTGKLGQNGV